MKEATLTLTSVNGFDSREKKERIWNFYMPEQIK